MARTRRAPESEHARLVKRAAAWLAGRRCRVVLPEFSTWGTAHEIPDVIGWRVSYGGARSVLVEVKTTRSDFLADARKGVRAKPETGIGHMRWYFVPPGVVGFADVPPSWGLAECTGRSVRVVIEARPFAAYAERHEISLLVQALRREAKNAPDWPSKLWSDPAVPEGVGGPLEAGP